MSSEKLMGLLNSEFTAWVLVFIIALPTHGRFYCDYVVIVTTEPETIFQSCPRDRMTLGQHCFTKRNHFPLPFATSSSPTVPATPHGPPTSRFLIDWSNKSVLSSRFYLLTAPLFKLDSIKRSSHYVPELLFTF